MPKLAHEAVLAKPPYFDEASAQWVSRMRQGGVQNVRKARKLENERSYENRMHGGCQKCPECSGLRKRIVRAECPKYAGVIQNVAAKPSRTAPSLKILNADLIKRIDFGAITAIL